MTKKIVISKVYVLQLTKISVIDRYVGGGTYRNHTRFAIFILAYSNGEVDPLLRERIQYRSLMDLV